MGKMILTVDDSASMRQLIKLTLTGAGYDVLEAGDGKQALDKLKDTTVQMVVTDLNMPNMDGLTLIRELRQLPCGRGLPIVFLTTEADEGKKKDAKAAGATAWITKPFNQEQLLAVVKRIVGS